MTNSAGASPAVVRLSGPQGLVAAVPQFLGFVPEESLVLLCLRAPRGRIGPVARVDLCPPEANDALEQLISAALHYADATAVICYHQGPRPAALEALLSGLAEAGVPVTAALSVRDGTIRDASSVGSMALDPGVPVLSADDRQIRELAAASAMSGRRVLPNREALRASIAGPSGDLLVQARAAIVDVCEKWGAALSGGRRSHIRRVFAERARAALATAMTEHGETGCVNADTAAELIVLCADVATRDRIIGAAVGADDPDLLPVLISVASWCPDEESAELCAVLAVVAYRYGDGALAQCAVDRTVAVQPDHRLAHLMLSIMAAGLPPSELATMATLATTADGTDTPVRRSAAPRGPERRAAATSAADRRAGGKGSPKDPPPGRRRAGRARKGTGREPRRR
jgi:hypothetical protein